MQLTSDTLHQEPPHSDSVLIDRGYMSLVESWRRLAQLAAGSMIEEGEGYTLVSRGSPQPFFNTLFLTSMPVDLGALLAHARAFFSTNQQVPWSVQGMGAVAEALAAQAHDYGLVHADVEPAMLLTPLAQRPPTQSKLIIRPVETMEQLSAFDSIVNTCFGISSDGSGSKSTLADYQRVNLALYLGFVEGVPVVTALRSPAYQIAMIHAVCTLPAYRRRGFGEAMTWRAVLDGIAEGCTASFLTATPLGHSVYARMGYRECGEVHTWHAQVADM